MVTVVFLLLHTLKGLHSDFDSYMLCVTMGLDLIATAEWLRLWWWRRER